MKSRGSTPVPPYLFAELERKIAEKRREGVDVISLGIGDPDLPTPEPVVEALAAGGPRPGHAPVPDEPRLRRVPRGRGRLLPRPLRRRRSTRRPRSSPRSAARRPSATSASRCSTRATSCLSPDPGYPPYTAGPALRRRGGALPAARRGERLPPGPRLDPGRRRWHGRTSSSSTTRTTRPARSSSRATSSEAVAFARANDLIVVHDNAYSEICFDGYRAPSFLETPGAKEVGDRDLLALEGLEHDRLARRARRRQRGGRRALPAAEDEPRLGDVRGGPARDGRRAHRGTRLPARDVGGLPRAGATSSPRRSPRSACRSSRRRRRRTSGSRVPEGHTSESFAELVLEQAAVVVSPGPSYGPSGEGFVRISLTVAGRSPRGGRAPDRIFASRAGIIDGVTAHQPDPAPGAEPERGFVVAVLAQGVDADEELAELRGARAHRGRRAGRRARPAPRAARRRAPTSARASSRS